MPCRQSNGLNTTFCGPARDTLLSNQDTEKLNFDTNYKTIDFVTPPPPVANRRFGLILGLVSLEVTFFERFIALPTKVDKRNEA